MSRIFSGIQPSGELHIGNYLGAVRNWVALQRRYPGTLICVVDYHAITGHYDTDLLRLRRWEMARSLLAAGIDPEHATLFLQSEVPEHTELSWIFTTATPLGELRRQTQFKEKSGRRERDGKEDDAEQDEGSDQENKTGGGESIPAGLLMYPVLQAADILLYRADMVPVGEDQVQHLELARDVARRWNSRFGEGFFPEPKVLLTPTRRLMGLDGQAKMSKSLGNTVGLMETDEQLWAKLRPAMTDPQRKRRTDPGDPDVCNIFQMHKGFNPPETIQHVDAQCRSAGWGCIDCKQVLLQGMTRELAPIRARAALLEEEPARVADALADGARAARALAQETMREVKQRMGLDTLRTPPVHTNATALPSTPSSLPTPS